jgi:hypothetical protein
MSAMPPSPDAGAAMPPAPAGADGQMPDQDQAGGDQKFTLGSLADFINNDPEGAMAQLRDKVSNSQIATSHGPTEAWSLLSPDHWENADDATKGMVLGRIMDLLPVEMKAEPDNSEGEEVVMQAPIKKTKVEASVADSNEAIRRLAIGIATKPKLSVKSSYNGMAKKEAQAKPVETYSLFEGTPVVDGRTGQLLTHRDIVERNKTWGIKPTDPFSINGIDFANVWETQMVDRFYREHQDADGHWVGGYINNRFEVDRTDNTLNNYQLLPGERRKPYLPQYGLTEARLESQRVKAGVEGASVFNWHEARAGGRVKTAGHPNIKTDAPFRAFIERVKAFKTTGLSLDESVKAAKILANKMAGKACPDCGTAIPEDMDGKSCSICSRDKAKKEHDREALGNTKRGG